MIKVLIGDIFTSKMQTIVNTVNCVGVMGKGIALKFKEHFPDMFKEYRNMCKIHEIKPGIPYIYKNLFGDSVLNFPTKDHWRSPSKVSDIINGLDIFIRKYKEWGIKSIAFPPLGCGNGGLEWNLIGKIMYQKLLSLDIPIELYAPFGTSTKELRSDFLQEEIALLQKGNLQKNRKDISGKMQGKIKLEWIAVLDTVYQLQERAYTPKVGRIIFQKICYVITEMGINTGFHFKQGQYGPFSDEVKNMITVFANANLIQEKQFGKMTMLIVNKEFLDVRKKFAMELEKLAPKIFKTVDLFSRIKNTESAEEVTTVFYASQQLKKNNFNQPISEKMLFDYILKWKPYWNNEEKKMSLISTIRNLVIMKWLKITYSKELPELDFI